MKSKYIYLTEKYHMAFHFFGGLVVLIILTLLGIELNIGIAFAGIAGSFLPDLDHVLYYYGYGWNDEYSRKIRKLVSQGKFRDLYNFCGDNHKDLTGLLSHNFAMVLISFGLMVWMHSEANYLGMSFWLGVVLHFLYDIFEDLILLDQLNPNWWLKFGKSRK